MTERTIASILTARPASDGAGVKLHRIVSPDGMRRLDPFLMLDEFRSDAAADYIAGFPAHPHRGFETVTYMLEGEMLHEDHLGNRGRLSSGGVQWMTAGRGVIHSEMPQQEQGRMHGFQLWVNLPAAEKMKEPAYRDIPAASIPTLQLPGGGELRVIAGHWVQADQTVTGAVQGVTTDPLYLDVNLPADASLTLPVAAGYTAFTYVYDGGFTIAGKALQPRQMAVLADGDTVSLQAGGSGGRALLLAARPLGEPIAHYGPFVMNTAEEIARAIADYQAGRLTG